MARFYSALATDGSEPTPQIKRGPPQRTRRISIDSAQIAMLRKAMMGVVSEGGTAAAAAISGVSVAGKTGTAQTMRFSPGGKPLYYAWFAGMAPANDPQIVVVVMVPNVTFEGATSAGLATKIISHYLHKVVNNTIINTG
jgi:cell division protein FtsI/penicillin-binding protein 2